MCNKLLLDVSYANKMFAGRATNRNNTLHTIALNIQIYILGGHVSNKTLTKLMSGYNILFLH